MGTQSKLKKILISEPNKYSTRIKDVQETSKVLMELLESCLKSKGDRRKFYKKLLENAIMNLSISRHRHLDAREYIKEIEKINA